MFKIKSIIVGVVLQLISFIFFSGLVVFCVMLFGDVQNAIYMLWLEIASYVSVIIGAFISARIAWEKGAIYGLFVASIWIIIRIIYSVCITGGLDIISMLIKIIVVCAVGCCAGALGVTGRKNRF